MVGPKKSDFSIPRYELHFSVVRYENEGFFLVLSGETIWISTRCIFFLQKFVFKISVFSFSVTSTHFLTSTSLYIDNNSKASDLLLLLDWFCGGAWLGIRSCERFGPTVSEKIGTSFWIIWKYFKSEKVSKISGTWSDIGQQNTDWSQPSWEIRASTEAGDFFLSDFFIFAWQWFFFSTSRMI